MMDDGYCLTADCFMCLERRLFDVMCRMQRTDVMCLVQRTTGWLQQEEKEEMKETQICKAGWASGMDSWHLKRMD
jgi:hypothetical protein